MNDPGWQPVSIDPGTCPSSAPAWVLVAIGAASVVVLGVWVYLAFVWRSKRRKP